MAEAVVWAFALGALMIVLVVTEIIVEWAMRGYEILKEGRKHFEVRSDRRKSRV